MDTNTVTTKAPTVDANGTIQIVIGSLLVFVGLLATTNSDAQLWLAYALLVGGWTLGLFGTIRAVRPRAHATQDHA